MIDHVSTYATDYAKTKRFYDAALAALGYVPVMEMTATWNPAWPTQRMCAYGVAPKATLWLSESKTAHTPGHLAFVAPDRAAVDAFYKAALATGGKDNGAPGPRPHYHEAYYGAFVLDPDGNNVEAVCHRPG